MGFPGGSAVKNQPVMQEMGVQSLGQEAVLEKDMAIYSNIVAWEIPWAEEPCRLQSMKLQKNWTQLSDYTTNNIIDKKQLFEGGQHFGNELCVLQKPQKIMRELRTELNFTSVLHELCDLEGFLTLQPSVAWVKYSSSAYWDLTNARPARPTLITIFSCI